MKTYCQQTQDAADELILFADTTSQIYPRRLGLQAKLRDALKADPNTPYGAVGYRTYANAAMIRYVAELGRKPAGWRTASLSCFTQDCETADREELKVNPTAFDSITPESIERFKQGYPAGYFRP